MQDHSPSASLPKLFAYEVDDHYEETWAAGIDMFQAHQSYSGMS